VCVCVRERERVRLLACVLPCRLCACVYVCVCEGERERERGSKTASVYAAVSLVYMCVYVCVCVCVKERRSKTPSVYAALSIVYVFVREREREKERESARARGFFFSTINIRFTNDNIRGGKKSINLKIKYLRISDITVIANWCVYWCHLGGDTSFSTDTITTKTKIQIGKLSKLLIRISDGMVTSREWVYWSPSGVHMGWFRLVGSLKL